MNLGRFGFLLARCLWSAGIFLASGANAAGLDGDWFARITSVTSEPQYVRVTLHSAAEAVTGTWGNAKVEGTLTAGAIRLTVTAASGASMGHLEGKRSGDEFSGEGSLARNARAGGPVAAPQKIAWKLSRIPQPPAGGPRTWNFEPKVFYSYYSAQNPPALHVFPGDTVRTWTVDANGTGSHSEPLAPSGDAVTGPFYIEGALPGDTLVVKLNRVRINRATARQGSRINGHAVTTAYASSATYGSFDGEWLLDAERNIARISHPTERLKNLTVPIVPMLGCVGVAPRGDESYRATDLGPFGGNMDYNQNVEGTTLYFPVFHPGALFVLGDAHAAMGDGEITGSALETSMDVEFTVDVVKGYATAAPRAETAGYLVSFGIAGSLAEALQNATSQLGMWLKRDYHLNDNEVGLLLGAVLKYDVTELVDPKYNVVAKVPKSALALLQ